jgi:hypothetical protein
MDAERQHVLQSVVVVSWRPTASLADAFAGINAA